MSVVNLWSSDARAPALSVEKRGTYRRLPSESAARLRAHVSSSPEGMLR